MRRTGAHAEGPFTAFPARTDQHTYAPRVDVLALATTYSEVGSTLALDPMGVSDRMGSGGGGRVAPPSRRDQKSLCSRMNAYARGEELCAPQQQYSANPPECRTSETC